MAEVAVATMVGGAVLNRLFQEIHNYATRRVRGGCLKVEDEEAKLRSFVTDLQKLLFNNRGKQSSDDKWMEELQKIVYDAEDALDEFGTGVLQGEVRPRRNMVRSLISSLFFRCRMNTVWNRLGRLATERGMLKSIEDTADDRGARDTPQGQKEKTSSLPMEPRMFGRDAERDKILGWLLPEFEGTTGRDQPAGVADDEENNYSVLFITGIAGIGKTTLAQDIYNDKRVRGSFKLLAWVDVCNNDVVWVTKRILESTKKAPEAANLTELDPLQGTLKDLVERVEGPFLLVLDGLRDVDHRTWKSLQKPLQSCIKGSRVLVTTQRKEIAGIMSEQQSVDLTGLSFDMYWPLFKKHAFGSENSDLASPRQEEIAKEIAKKMGGSPLAAETLGRQLMRSKPEDKWEEILNSELWQVAQERYDILPSLLLSYDNLPGHLKPCFLYCSILPKNETFQGTTLVQLWMAQGFVLPPAGNRSMEEVGRDYLEDLVGWSFFHFLGNDTYATHSLIHDLARSILKNQCLWAESISKSRKQWLTANGCSASASETATDVIQFPRDVRHLSCFHNTAEHCDQLMSLCRFHKLRTFLYVYAASDETSGSPTDELGVNPKPKEELTRHSLSLRSSEGSYRQRLLSPRLFMSYPARVPLQWFESWRRLRVLQLLLCSFPALPESISNLIHLRYLNISFTLVKKLPKALTRICNLQTLVLLGNPELKQLPKDMKMLINLRHLEADAELVSAIAGIGKLRCLQKLQGFKVGKDAGHRIAELRDMSELRALSLCHLENVDSKQAAEEARLETKCHLRSLKLEWNGSANVGSNMRSDGHVLDGLRPHSNLKQLAVSGYGGLRSPSWMQEDGHLQQLKKLHLHQCGGWEALPSLGLLRSLRSLKIEAMPGTRSMAHDSSRIAEAFPSLESLEIDGMPDWVEWQGVEQCRWFPRLLVLKMSDCPMLSRLPALPLELTELVISNLGLNALPGFWLPRNDGVEGNKWRNSSLHLLSISSCTCLSSLRGGLMESRRLAALRVLNIVRCEELAGLLGGAPSDFASLESVTIEECPKLVIPPGHPLPPSLKGLHFDPCNASLIDSVTQQLRETTALQTLHLRRDSARVLLTDKQFQIEGCDYLRNNAFHRWLSLRGVASAHVPGCAYPAARRLLYFGAFRR